MSNNVIDAHRRCVVATYSTLEGGCQVVLEGVNVQLPQYHFGSLLLAGFALYRVIQELAALLQ